MVSFELGKEIEMNVFSSCHERGTQKKSRVPMKNRTSDHRFFGDLSVQKGRFRDETKKNIFFYLLRYFDFYVFLLSTNLVSCLFHFLAINHFFISTFLFRPATQIWYFGLFPFAWNQDIIICCCNSSFLNFDTFVFVVLGEFGVLPCFHYLKLITK